MLACTDRQRGDTVAGEPVGVLAAVGNLEHGLPAEQFGNEASGPHDLARFLEAIGKVIAVALKLDLGVFALIVGDNSGGLVECVSVSAGNGRDKSCLVTARFATDLDEIGDDIGGLARASSLFVAERPDIRCALAAILVNFA